MVSYDSTMTSQDTTGFSRNLSPVCSLNQLSKYYHQIVHCGKWEDLVFAFQKPVATLQILAIKCK